MHRIHENKPDNNRYLHLMLNIQCLQKLHRRIHIQMVHLKYVYHNNSYLLLLLFEQRYNHKYYKFLDSSLNLYLYIFLNHNNFLTHYNNFYHK